jgi:Phosphodiester glycosidase
VSEQVKQVDPTGSVNAPVRRRRWIRRTRRIVAVVVLVAFGIVTTSYVSALTGPGNDSLSVKSVEWLRNHGMRGVVNRVETRYYTAKQPPIGGTPKDWPIPTATPTATATPSATPTPSQAPSSPAATNAGSVPAAAAPGGPSPVVPFAPIPLPGEGVWQATGRIVGNVAPLYTTFMRPDRVHTSVVVGLAWMDPKRVTFTFVPGLTQPGGPPGTWGGQVPLSQRPSLLATFNSAFKIQDSEGGYYTHGTTVATLKPGIASLVIYADGTATVGLWGRDVSMTPKVVTVRQNLHLLVDGGQPTPQSASNSSASWGPTLGNRVFVWRSALGITADGALVYAAGNGMSVQSLAALLAAAHCVRAMELDINPYWTNFYSYTAASAGDPRLVVPQKLLPDMQRSLYRYLSPDSRDFVAVQLRP